MDPLRPRTAADVAVGVKRVLAASIRRKLEEDRISASAFARRIKTGRVAVRRLLDPRNTAVTLKTIAKATNALGLEIAIGVRPLALPALQRIAEDYVASTDPTKTSEFEEAFVAGYYGRTPRSVTRVRGDAKAAASKRTRASVAPSAGVNSW